MKLTIMNDTGHTNLELNEEGMVEQILDHPTHWVFIDGVMTSRAQIGNIDWDEVATVRLAPPMVGGY